MTQDAGKNRRQHDRFQVEGHADFVEAATGMRLPVDNLGYGGMFLRGRLPGPERAGGEVRGTLTVLDVIGPVSGHVVRATASGFGVMFDNSDGALLERLRLVLAPAHYGKTMVAMNPAYVADAYRAPEWAVYQGLGPTVLTVKYTTPAHEEVVDFSLTVRPGGYQVVEMLGGELRTGVMKEGAGGLKFAVFDASIEEQRNAVRRALSVLLGMSELPVGDKVRPLVDALKKSLA